MQVREIPIDLTFWFYFPNAADPTDILTNVINYYCYFFRCQVAMYAGASSVNRAGSASDVFSGGLDASDLVLLVHLSLNRRQRDGG